MKTISHALQQFAKHTTLVSCIRGPLASSIEIGLKNPRFELTTDQSTLLGRHFENAVKRFEVASRNTPEDCDVAYAAIDDRALAISTWLNSLA